MGPRARVRLALVAAAAALAAGPAPAAAEPSRPNIVLYLTDDVGIGMVGQDDPSWSFFEDHPEQLEGIPAARRVRTPTLVRLAKEGKRLMRSYVASSVCGPSRHSLMTGIQVGAAIPRGNSYGEDETTDTDIAENTTTIALALSSAGYTTAAFGKWGMATSPNSSGSPCKQGFDLFFGQATHRDMGNAFPRETVSCTRNRDATTIAFPNNAGSSPAQCVDTGKCTYFDHWVRSKALDFVRNHDSDAGEFFIYWATSAGHSSLFDQRNKYKSCDYKTHPVPSYGIYTEAALEGTGRNTPEIRGLMAMVTYTVDEDLRLLLEALEEKGIARNTLIVYTTDNGPHVEAFADKDYDPLRDLVAGGGLQGTKRRMREAAIRAPTIAWWPGVIPAGTTSFYPVAHYDMALTFADAAGVPASHPSLAKLQMRASNGAPMGGMSILSILKSNDDSVVDKNTRAFVNSEICFIKLTGGNSGSRPCPVRWVDEIGCAYAFFDLSDWPRRLLKLVRDRPEYAAEVYDIVADPFETKNLLDTNPELGPTLEAKRAKARTPSCEAEKAFNPACYPDACNIHRRKQDCLSQQDCHWNAAGSPYRCETLTCGAMSSNERACDNNAACEWRPWRARSERCQPAQDANKYPDFCNAIVDDDECRRDRACYKPGEAKLASGAFSCLPKSCARRRKNKDVCLAGEGCEFRRRLGCRDA